MAMGESVSRTFKVTAGTLYEACNSVLPIGSAYGELEPEAFLASVEAKAVRRTVWQWLWRSPTQWDVVASYENRRHEVKM